MGPRVQRDGSVRKVMVGRNVVDVGDLRGRLEQRDIGGGEQWEVRVKGRL